MASTVPHSHSRIVNASTTPGGMRRAPMAPTCVLRWWRRDSGVWSRTMSAVENQASCRQLHVRIYSSFVRRARPSLASVWDICCRQLNLLRFSQLFCTEWSFRFAVSLACCWIARARRWSSFLELTYVVATEVETGTKELLPAMFVHHTSCGRCCAMSPATSTFCDCRLPRPFAFRICMCTTLLRLDVFPISAGLNHNASLMSRRRRCVRGPELQRGVGCVYGIGFSARIRFDSIRRRWPRVLGMV
ncbi:hypothetical protein R3P38DRAFT_614408 [Favolaschia claudopus]|uniref:Uncharacterized protein n=1 Tax=Favolaschia claudopus TaxID=2862362 RepID=A0AAW0CBN9_9AGAR